MWRAPRRGRRDEEDEKEESVIAVAIDADKNSQHALKWMTENLLPKGLPFFLLHVRRKTATVPSLTSQHFSKAYVNHEERPASLEQLDSQTRELLLPFQCFCNKQGLQCKEVILDSVDVSKTIADFVMHQGVDKLVMGASSRGAFSRTLFKQADVPTSVSKIIPEFCGVYVITKGKISSVKPATRPNRNRAKKLELGVEIVANQFQSTKSERRVRNPIFPLEKESNVSDDYLNYSYQSASSCPSPCRVSLDRASNRSSVEVPNRALRYSHLAPIFYESSQWKEEQQNIELNKASGANWSDSSDGTIYDYFSPTKQDKTTVSSSSSSSSVEELEAELQRLKIELKLKSLLLEKAYTEDVNKDPSSLGVLVPKVNENKLNSTSEATENSERNQNDSNFVAENSTSIQSFSSLPYRRYTNDEISKATENFSDRLKIGEGAYGPVYKATLDHTLVAIKVLRSDDPQGMKQFQKEVEVLSRIRHPNMVLLIGACPDSGCLVYEYMANGSLQDCLINTSKPTPLTWQLRFKIAAEIASGLLFLHQTKPEPLVHRDLKPDNILLDHNFVAKIADVGLARLIPRATAENYAQLQTAAAGTFCYIDPEYQKSGMVSTQSDVYALGIVILQLITGSEPMGLAYRVDEAMDSGKLGELLDPVVLDWPMEETFRLARLGLKCAELKRIDRPDLASVLLPELNRLREFADQAGGTSLMYHK